VYRTTDGGRHWERVLFAGENAGCSGLSMDAHDPHTLIAGMWQIEMHTWGEYSGGPQSGIYISHDGGTKWTRLEDKGLVSSWLSEPTAERGGRAKRCYRLEALGERALQESAATAKRIWDALVEALGKDWVKGWGKETG
jgi:photosystem II stability/assembly factor-like uncharacterized protein